MTPFIESEVCRGRLKCHLCRADNRLGDQFRRTFAKHFEMPGEGLFDCPFEVEASPVVLTVSAAPRADKWKEDGPKMWAELHARPAAYTGDAAAELVWLERFARRIGCGECQRHWRELVGKAPVAKFLKDAVWYFAWTVQVHNAVSARLGRPGMTVGEAADRWRFKL